MNYLQAVQEITEVVPDFGNEVKEIKIQNSYSIIRTFTERIKNMIRQNDRNLLFRSLQKMDKIYNDGDSVLKNAIETNFIYSLDNFTAFCSRDDRKMIFSHISPDLQKVYSRQIYSHGL
jgi:phage-related protein